MATNHLASAPDGTFLLELLSLAGWSLELRRREPPTIRASRAEVELEVVGTSLGDAAGRLFARAMRSGRRAKP